VLSYSSDLVDIGDVINVSLFNANTAVGRVPHG